METVGRGQLPAAMFDLSLPAATFDLSLLVVNSGSAKPPRPLLEGSPCPRQSPRGPVVRFKAGGAGGPDVGCQDPRGTGDTVTSTAAEDVVAERAAAAQLEHQADIRKSLLYKDQASVASDCDNCSQIRAELEIARRERDLSERRLEALERMLAESQLQFIRQECAWQQHFEKMQADVAQQFEKVQADVYKHKEEDPGMVKIIVGDDLRFPEQPVAVVCELEPICPDDELEPIRPYHRSPYHSPVDQHLRFDELPRLMSSRDELTRPDPHIAVRDELEPSHPYHSQTRMLLSETSWSTATFNDPPVAYHLHFKDE